MNQTEPITEHNWQEARKVPVRARSKFRSKPGKNIFKGEYTIESVQLSGVSVLRLNVSPDKKSEPPASFAVLSPDALQRAADESFQQEEWPSDFDDQCTGEVGERRASDSHGHGTDSENYAAEFENLIEEKGWQRVSLDDARFPLNFEWRQTKESRYEFSFDLPEGAQCLGLGERLSTLNLRSKSHTLFNSDDHAHIPSLDEMYKSVPFLIVSIRGECYGIFLDSPAFQRWNLDEDLTGKATVELLSRRGWQMYLIGPSSLSAVVAAFTTLTGRHKLPPVWALGHQQSRWSYPDQDTIVRLAYEFRTRQIPCDVLVLDIDYMDEYRVFTHSKERFPDLANLVADLNCNNFKVVTIIDPGVKRDDQFFVFADGEKHGYFCKKPDGELFTGKVWPGESAFPDFVREDVRKWWAAQHGFHTELGVAGIWNDMNEPAFFENPKPLSPDICELPAEREQPFVQEPPEGKCGHFEVRNVYGQQMSRATFQGLLALRPNQRPFVLSRSAYAGSQRYSAVWLGDNKSWWEHLKLSIPMLVNIGLSGIAFAGVDIGGFGDDCTAELLTRWYGLGIFYPFFRNHCAMQAVAQEPWVFGPKTEAHIKRFIETRYRLLPYLISLFVEHTRTGAPIMRPLSWHYPNDEFAQDVDDQFLFGENILVAPILERAKTSRAVYLPEGLWHPFEGGEPLSGGKLHKVSYRMDEVPAFVRDGAILPLADPMQSTAEYDRAAITFICYGDSGKCSYYEDDMQSFDYEQGEYNEWRIKIDQGEFIAQPVELGFEPSRRKFFVSHKGQKHEVVLE